MDATNWRDELNYCAALVRTGGDSPRVPSTSVNSYLEMQHNSARNETLRGGARNPSHNMNAAECLMLLMMIRQQTDNETVKGMWRTFWSRAETLPA